MLDPDAVPPQLLVGVVEEVSADERSIQVIRSSAVETRAGRPGPRGLITVTSLGCRVPALAAAVSSGAIGLSETCSGPY